MIMKKIVMLLVLSLTLSCFLVSCTDIMSGITGNNNGNTDTQGGEDAELTVDYVYELASAAGYSGTLEEFIEEFICSRT